MHNLNNLNDPGSGFTLIEARGVNDSGQIAGYGSNAHGLVTPS